MNDDPNDYIGTLDEKLEAEVQEIILEDGGLVEGLCHNCADRTYVKLVAGILMCRTCAERYPDGPPF
jgi:hypothetical protein